MCCRRARKHRRRVELAHIHYIHSPWFCRGGGIFVFNGLLFVCVLYVCFNRRVVALFVGAHACMCFGALAGGTIAKISDAEKREGTPCGGRLFFNCFDVHPNFRQQNCFGFSVVRIIRTHPTSNYVFWSCFGVKTVRQRHYDELTVRAGEGALRGIYTQVVSPRHHRPEPSETLRAG